MVEHSPCKRAVIGSIPIGGSTKEQIKPPISGSDSDQDDTLPVICRQLNFLPSRREAEIGTSTPTRDEETAEYFIKASAEQVVTRRSVQKERGFFGFGKYEETGRATESENRETRSQDESIKNLPKGQMEILMSDDTRGTLHSLLQVRPPEEVAIPGFQPALYPRMLHSRAESSGANLRFKDPDLARKYRVPSRQAGGFRK